MRFCTSAMRTLAKDWKWPEQARAEFELTAVNQSLEAGQQRKFWADDRGPLVAGCVSSKSGKADLALHR